VRRITEPAPKIRAAFFSHQRVERVTALRTALVRGFAPFLQDPRLKPAQKRMLRAILKEQLDEIFRHVRCPDAELKALFERLHGIGYADAVQGELEEARSGMAAMFDELGVTVDVPELHPDMSDEDLAAVAARLAEGMRHAEEQRTSQAASHRMTKRERREAERARRFEQLRKNNVGAVYKRLVKVLHPDLEADSVEREKKSRAMQEVTCKLLPESRAHLKAINIRFHDWRRTAGSRFMAGGMSPHYVQRFLDHANLSTTSRYLKIDQQGMHNALKAFEKARGGEDTQTDTETPATGPCSLSRASASLVSATAFRER
jgi:integrase-like protein